MSSQQFPLSKYDMLFGQWKSRTTPALHRIRSVHLNNLNQCMTSKIVLLSKNGGFHDVRNYAQFACSVSSAKISLKSSWVGLAAHWTNMNVRRTRTTMWTGKASKRIRQERPNQHDDKATWKISIKRDTALSGSNRFKWSFWLVWNRSFHEGSG